MKDMKNSKNNMKRK